MKARFKTNKKRVDFLLENYREDTSFILTSHHKAGQNTNIVVFSCPADRKGSIAIKSTESCAPAARTPFFRVAEKGKNTLEGNIRLLS